MLPPPTPIVFFHAHPDDETLATGVLLAALAEAGRRLAVVTATRGEQGEIIPGALTPGTSADELVAHRERELAGALAELGVNEHVFLGSPPALAEGRPARCYTDSGMAWVTETVAGPAETAGADSLTAAATDEAAADLAAYLRWFGAGMLVSYDAHGGYGHPDHIACHRIAQAAATLAGVPLWEVVSDVPAVPEEVRGASRHEGPAASYELPQYLPTVQRALGHYASQLRVDGTEVVHVGGQRQPIATTVRLKASFRSR